LIEYFQNGIQKEKCERLNSGLVRLLGGYYTSQDMVAFKK